MQKLTKTNLEHVTPEEVGIKSSAITAFINEINEKKLGLQSFTVVRHNKVCAQCFWKPYSAEYPHVLYSMSKSVTSTAIGFAVDEGLISVDDKVSDFFPEYKTSKLIQNRMITVKSLLTMHSDKLITVLDEKGNHDWAKQFFDAPFVMPPNSKFNYISENTFMLSAIISKVTGMSALDYLDEKMFKPLGIEKPFWEADGLGRNAGGWGLYMKSEDLAKFFLPYINEGKWIDGTELIPKNWVKEATKKQVDSVHDGYIDNMCGYGYQFWRNPVSNSYRADGLMGQRCFMFPDYDALVVLNSGESHDYEIMKVFWKHFPECFEYDALPKNKKDNDEMKEVMENCSVERLLPNARNEKLEKEISGRRIKCKSNKYCSVVSISITNMWFNKPGDLNEMMFKFTDDGLFFSWREKGEENTIFAKMDGTLGESNMHLQGIKYHVFAEASWQSETTLKLYIRPIETAHVRIFTFTFEGNKVHVDNDMKPYFKELATYYCVFAGMPLPKFSEGAVQDIVEGASSKLFEPDFDGKFE